MSSHPGAPNWTPPDISSVTDIQSIVEDGHKIQPGSNRVSLVLKNRHFFSNHASLLIETILKLESGKLKHLIFRSDLFYTPERWTDFVAADANVYVNVMDEAELRKFLKGRKRQSWEISRDQMIKLIKALQLEVRVRDRTYNIAGANPVSSTSYSKDYKKVHNCVSWCQGILKQELGIELGSKWTPIKVPKLIVDNAMAYYGVNVTDPDDGHPGQKLEIIAGPIDSKNGDRTLPQYYEEDISP